MDVTPRHPITRIRRETRRRTLSVSRIERLSQAMVRVWLEGEALHDFESAGADDHVKLFFETADGPEMRDYTPRLFDPAARTLAIDFALHGEGEGIGPATRWAMAAGPGDRLEIKGPRGSTLVPDDFDWMLLVGDETAVPAIGRRLEELRPDLPVTVVVSVAAGVERPPLPPRSGTEPIWVERTRQAEDGALLAAVRALDLPAGDGFVWIAAEGEVVRLLRQHLVEERGHDPSWMKAAGYWVATSNG